MSKIVKGQVREITIVNESKITRNNREIVNKYCEKIFKFGYDKRVIKHVDENHIDTLPGLMVTNIFILYSTTNMEITHQISIFIVYNPRLETTL